MQLDPDLTLKILENVAAYSHWYSISQHVILLATKEVMYASTEITQGR